MTLAPHSTALVHARSQRPAADEHAPYQAAYIGLVPQGDVLAVLAGQIDEWLAFAAALPAERAHHRYAPGKWSIVEVLGHVADAERVFAYRAMAFARGDRGPFPGFEEDAYVAAAAFDGRGLESVVRELVHLRRANLELFASFSPEDLLRGGTASGHTLSVRALLYIAAGHAAHHLNVLHTRYG